ncbi:MAG: hypothetical protein IPL96_08200 [Holophagaceae bacterium]|nr:hypothetical protein [Holophagaceae bacterium]
MKRIGKWLLYVFAGSALLLGLVHGVENWRGRRAWESWKRSREAAGDRYGWPAPPAPVPADQNFAAVPEVARAMRTDGQPFLDFRLPPEPATHTGWRVGRREDLRGWAERFQVADLQDGLAPAASRLAVLAAAARRSQCRLPVDERADEIPGLLGFRTAAKVLRLRALDLLAKGKVEEARADVVTLLRTAKHTTTSASLISALLQLPLAESAMQPIWEGISDHRWREEDLREIQAELGRLDLLASFAGAWRNERMSWSRGESWNLEKVAGMSAWDRAEAMNQAAVDGSDGPGRGRLALWALMPSGWIHQNLLTWDRMWVEHMEPCLDAPAHRYFPDRAEQASRAMQASAATGRHPYRFLAAIALPALLGQNLRVAQRQTALDQARVACALERHRLRHKAYPDSLAGLAPELLDGIPVDVPAGGRLKYRRERQGYLLYSLGSDGKDDGGRVATDPKQPWILVPGQGDWVGKIE